jgi:uncharacterized membrane protein YidH (DUF202 family)
MTDSISDVGGAAGSSGGIATTELARERNREAADRTLMAWVRTSLSLITFGFGIDRLFNYLESTQADVRFDPLRATRIVGGALIALGVLGLTAAIIQHWRILQRLKRGQFEYGAFRPITMVVAALLLLIGVFSFIGIMI